MPRDNLQTGEYREVDHWSKYKRDEGLLMLPVAGPAGVGEDPVEIVRVHAPVGYRTVDWKIHKRGNPPVCPNPNYSGTGNDVLCETAVDVNMPGLTVEGALYDWNVKGSYTYIQRTARQASDGFPTGNYPFTLATQDQAFLAIMENNGDTGSTTPPNNNPQAIDAWFGQPYFYIDSTLPFWFFDATQISG